MTNKQKAALTAGLLISMISHAQQNTQPQPQITQTQPCIPAKPGETVGVIQPPSNGPLASAATKACSKFGICLHPKAKPIAIADEKPCPAPTVSVPAPVSTPAIPLPARELCPPNSTRLTGQPYCLKADGVTLVDVVRVPASPSTPAPADATSAPAAQR